MLSKIFRPYLNSSLRRSLSTSNRNPYTNWDDPSVKSVFNLGTKDENGHIPLKLIRKTAITHDTYEFELEFPDSSWSSGLFPAGHIKLHVKDALGKLISKPYTPISSLQNLGSVIFVIKIYREHPDFPGGGAFTQSLERVQVGESILCEGPIGKLKYLGSGEF